MSTLIIDIMCILYMCLDSLKVHFTMAKNDLRLHLILIIFIIQYYVLDRCYISL